MESFIKCCSVVIVVSSLFLSPVLCIFRFGLCGDITSKTHRALSSWLIAMTVTVWLRPGMSFTGC